MSVIYIPKYIIKLKWLNGIKKRKITEHYFKLITSSLNVLSKNIPKESHRLCLRSSQFCHFFRKKHYKGYNPSLIPKWNVCSVRYKQSPRMQTLLELSRCEPVDKNSIPVGTSCVERTSVLGAAPTHTQNIPSALHKALTIKLLSFRPCSIPDWQSYCIVHGYYAYSLEYEFHNRGNSFIKWKIVYFRDENVEQWEKA